ncbi:MAG: hypothetical protein QXT64_04580 [Desulfurococcaceae archaeon]
MPSKIFSILARKPLQDYPRVPISPIVGSTDRVTYNFWINNHSIALDTIVLNKDGTNPLSIRLNGETQTLTLPAGGVYSFKNVLIEQIELIPHEVTGGFEVHPFLLAQELVDELLRKVKI